MITLGSLGFSPFFSSQLASFDDGDELIPARVVSDQRGQFEVLGETAHTATLSGRLRHESEHEALPVTGDWVAIRAQEDGRAVIHHVLERRTVLRRKSAGKTARSQVLAANVDTFFVVTTATDELNVRRIERFLAAIYSGGATPVIVLNKIDLAQDRDAIEAMVRSIRTVARDVEVVAVSAKEATGIDSLSPWLVPASTVALVGSSGVGKSSLINRLLQTEAQRASAIAEDGRGRHTTTGRSLHRLSSGAWLMDTPGLREFAVVDDDDGAGIRAVFSDIDALASECHFRDCTHHSEPGCAVIAAVEDGRLSEERLESLHKLEREARALAAKHDRAAAVQQKRRFKEIARSIRSIERTKRRDD